MDKANLETFKKLRFLFISALEHYGENPNDHLIIEEARQAIKSEEEAVNLHEELVKVLEACMESLEYVNNNHPQISGWGVREERIAKALALLERVKAEGHESHRGEGK